ncbi:MAG TPA: T9SS type A sorting domain-containing protein [Candidatus Kapabacteria bacterium]|nr:T9SS type A sorting domain-containing protein [Candidatus Kapabacteria bacterium]
MTKYKLIILLVICTLLASVNSAFSAHFTLTGSSSENLTLVVPLSANPRIGDDLLTSGDEVAVFDSEGNCWGAIVWAEANDAITVYGFVEGDEGLGIPDEPGMPIGEAMQLRIWDNETNTEYSIISSSLQSGNMKYDHNKFLVLTNLQAQLVPAVPAITNPLNNAVGVTLSGNLTWNTALRADSYDYTLSANADFSAPVLDGNTTGTSVAYTGLSNGTVYYMRVRGKNAVGNGTYANSTFTTILPTANLTTPAHLAKAQGLSGTMQWNSVVGATSYDIQIANDNGFGSIVASTSSATNSYGYAGLSYYSNYFWRVRARNGANYGEYSSVFELQTKLSLPMITSPANNAGGIGTSGNIVWNEVIGATFYTIQISKDAEFSTLLVNQSNVATNTFAYSALENYVTYYVRVRANNADGNGDWYTSHFRTILAAPNNVSPLNDSFSQGLNGTISWSSVLPATAYEVEIATNSLFTTIVASNMNVATTSFNYTGLNNATKYYWRVRAKNAEGISANSVATNFTTLIGKATLVSPANSATNVNALSGNFTWNAPATATKYRIQVSTSPLFTTLVYDQSDLSTTTFAYTNLESKIVYYWKVYSSSATNNGSWSDVFSFTSGLNKVALASPSNNTQGLELNNVTLSWNALSGASTYKLIVSKNADLSSPIYNMTGLNTLSQVIGSLEYNQNYYWAVYGQDGFGDGPKSDVWTFGTKVDMPTLVAPANNEIDVALTGTFTWNAAAGATEYQVQASEANDFSTLVVNISNINATTFNYSNLANNTTHFWRVRGYKAGQAGEWSNVWTFKTIKLLPPDLVLPENNRVDVYFDVTLDWNAATQATAYDVQLATDNAFTNIVAHAEDITATDFDVTGLSYESTYYWRARSKNALGASNWSTAWSFNTIKYPNFVGMDEVCENEEAVYSTDESDVIDYAWSVTGGTIIGSSTERTVTVKWTSAGTGEITLNRSSAEWGEFTDSKSMEVNVLPKDPVVVTVTPNTYYTNKICVKETVTYTASFDKTGINEYYWSIGGTIVGTGATLDYRFENAGTYSISLEVFGPGCKNGQTTYQVNVTEDCPLTILVDNFTACKNSSPVITPDVFGQTGNYGFTWTPSGDFVSATVQNPTVKNATISKQFIIKVTDLTKNVHATKNVYMTVSQSPNLSFSRAFYTLRNADPIDLTDEDIVKVTVSGGTAPYNYIWKDDEGNVIDPTEIYPPIGTSKFYLTVVDAKGCSSIEKRFMVIRYPSKDIYEFAMPGIAGLGYMLSYPNPAVDVVNVIAEFADESEATLKVYDLRGDLVFITNIPSTKQYDGQINVSQLPSGSYTIVIETFEDTIVNKFIKK